MKVLLVGDNCEDVWIEGDVTRLSPEKPVPVFVPVSRRSNPGMGGNVLANMRSLAPSLEVITLLGYCGAKTRYVDRETGHHFLRVDSPTEAVPLDPLTVSLALEPSEFSAVVISDYDKGFLTDASRLAVARMCLNHGLPLFVDTKTLLGEWTAKAIVKINAREAAHQAENNIVPWQACESLIVTRGSQGMDLLRRDGTIDYHLPAVPIEVRDGAGCGDTVLAALVVRYLEARTNLHKQALREAMDWAGRAGAVAVSKRGVVAVKREEVQ